ncbi:hypothetical protein SK128_010924, partial [Halocaridina rubra]
FSKILTYPFLYQPPVTIVLSKGVKIYNIGPKGLADGITRLQLPSLHVVLSDIYQRGCFDPELELRMVKDIGEETTKGNVNMT